MRVVHLSTSLRGGAGIAARRLHSALLEAGVDSWLVAVSGTVDLLDEAENPNRIVVVRRSPLDRLASVASMKANRLSWSRNGVLYTPFSSRVNLAHVLERLKPDILHGHNFFNFFDPARLSTLAPAARTAFTLHDERIFTAGCHYSIDCLGFTESCSPCIQSRPATKPLIRLQKARRSLSPNALIIGPSEWILKQAERSVILGRHELHLIRNAIPTGLFSPTGANARAFESQPRRLRILWHSGKEDATILRAVRSLRPNSDTDSSLLVRHTGDSPASTTFSEALGTFSSQTQIASLLRDTDIYVHSSVSDNSPNSIAEALCSGVAVFSSQTGGSPELIDETGGGAGFAYKDDRQLASLLTRAVDSPSELESMKRNALKCRPLVDPSAIAHQHIWAYERCLAR